MIAQSMETSAPEKTYAPFRTFDRGLERVEDVMAAEQAWLRLKREMEEERRQKEIMGETLQYLHGTLRAMERQVAAAKAEARKAEARADERVAAEEKRRDEMKWEMDQLQQRLAVAVDQVASERSKGWVQRLLGR
jgi:hypothetical protein